MKRQPKIVTTDLPGNPMAHPVMVAGQIFDQGPVSLYRSIGMAMLARFTIFVLMLACVSVSYAA